MADPSLITAGIQAGAGIIDNFANLFSAKKARQWQEKMMDKQNAYNSPIQQMERLKAAGLNPHLVYGSGNAIQASASPSSSPGYQQTNFGQVATDYITNRLTVRQEENAIAQNDNIRASTDKIHQEINESQIRMNKMGAEMANILQNTARSKLDYDIASHLKQNTIDTALQTFENLKSQGSLTNANIQLAIKDLAVKDANINLSNAQVRKIDSDIQVNAQRIVNMKTENSYRATQAAIEEIKHSFWKQGINPDKGAIEQLLQGAISELKGITGNNPITNLYKGGQQIRDGAFNFVGGYVQKASDWLTRKKRKNK